MGAVVDVGVPFDALEGEWELGAAQVCGMMLTEADAVHTCTWFVRDDAGRLVRRVRAEPGRAPADDVRYTYDAGRLSRREEWRPTDGKPYRTEAIDYLRDASGRITGTRTERWSRAYTTMDAATDTWSSTVDPETWAYDRSGRVIREGEADHDHSEIERDAKGRVLTVTNVSSYVPLTTDVDGPAPERVTRREAVLSVVWAADGRTATETLSPGRARSLVVTWTFDADGLPLGNSVLVQGTNPEVATWYRDCATFPPVPVPEGAP
jgi:hypothetical protein